MVPHTQPDSVVLSATATIPELQQSKTAVLNTLASKHSRRSYVHAIDRFIAWYCSEPRLTFNRSVVVKYRSFLERLSLVVRQNFTLSSLKGHRLDQVLPTISLDPDSVSERGSVTDQDQAGGHSSRVRRK